MASRVVSWHDSPLALHKQKRDDHLSLGFRFLSLSLHGTVSDPRYTAVMIERTAPLEQHDFPLLTAQQFEATFKAMEKKGFGPTLVSAMGTAGEPLFAAVFEKMAVIPLTRHRLHTGPDTNPHSLQGMNKTALEQRLILRCLAAYGDESNPRFAAIWTPNTQHAAWNADGLLETAAQYQERFDAQKGEGCRPSWVTLQGASGRYCSVFVHDESGRPVALHGMTGDQYQSAFDKHVTGEGLLPVCVQGGGRGAGTRYAALFAVGERPGA